LFWDSSAESLGIGTSSPSKLLDVSSNSAPTIRISNTRNDSNWDTDPVFGALEFYSADGSGSGASVRASVKAEAFTAFGNATDLVFRNGDSQGVQRENLRIDYLGRVGIGTSLPSQDLHIREDSGDCNLLIDSANGASQIFFGDDESVNIGNIRYDHASNYMRFSTNSDEAMRIDSAGNVGIGTDSPARNLVVKGSIPHVSILANTNTQDCFLDFGDGDDDNRGRIVYANSSDSLAFYSNGSEAMRIDSSGNVGIGTSSPTAGRLQVNGEKASQGIHFLAEDNSSGNTGGFWCGNSGTTFEADPANAIASSFMGFNVDGSEAMRIDSSGNLLVGKAVTGTNNIGTQLSGDGFASIVNTNNNIPLYLENKAVGGNCRISFANDSHGGCSLGLNNGGDFTLFDTTAATTRFIVTDDKILTATGGLAGIELGGTGVANRLDDYEEGTWIPELADASSGGNTATGTANGWYTKVGNLVTIGIRLLNIDTTGMTSSNDLFIRNLPFASSSTSYGNVGGVLLDRLTFTGYVVPVQQSGASHINLRDVSSGAFDANLLVSSITSTGSDIELSLQYKTA